MKSSLALLISLLVFISCKQNQPETQNEETSKNENKICSLQLVAVEDSLSNIRNLSSLKIPISEGIREYVDKIKRIDFSNCPESYRISYSNHAKNWLKMISLTNEHSELRGEMKDLFKILESGKDASRFESLNLAIQKSKAKVMAVAKMK